MSVSDPSSVLAKVESVRVREVPEWGCLLVYTPDDPNVHYLDPHSWLLYELAQGETREAMFEQFSACLPEGTGVDAASSAFDHGVATLVEKGILHAAAA